MRTPFYECHKKYGGKIVDFHGWDLPIQFEGIVKEHQTVREKSGLFDVSHMGEIIIKGQEAAKFT
ncbi:MAG: glycine cleavage system aminomethyltransferase GcvT, partial [Candidatus Muiribacteriota bacterium]